VCEIAVPERVDSEFSDTLLAVQIVENHVQQVLQMEQERSLWGSASFPPFSNA